MKFILRILSYFFGLIVSIRNFLFDKNLIQIYHGRLPVISIGNISVGGSGKTPLTIALAKILISRGYLPVVVARSYKSKQKSPLLLIDYRKEELAPEIIGDELALIGSNLNIPICAGNSKYKNAVLVNDKLENGIIIVDDGFQHRKLHRDLDIIIIDKKTLQDNLLPLGRLRECTKSLYRADIIFILEDINTDEEKLLPGDVLKVYYKIKNAKIYNLFSEEIQFTNSMKLIVLTGIAKPERFINSLNDSGYILKHKYIFDDHHNYKDSEIQSIIKLAQKDSCHIITTEKDAVKLRKYENLFKENNINIFVLPINLEITSGYEEFLNKISSII